MKTSQKILISHLIFWAIEISLELIQGYDGGLEYWVVGYMFYWTVFYLSYFIIIPEMVSKRTLLRLGTCTVVLLVLYYIINFEMKHYVFHLMNPLYHFNEYTANRLEGAFNSSLLFLVTCFSLRLFRDWYTNNDENARLSMEKAEGELKSYKNKMDLSTMKVTLAKMKKMATEDPKSIQPTIIELSNLLRFSLYESNMEQVTIGQEIEAIKNQVSLCNQVNGVGVDLIYDETLGEEKVSSGVLLKSVTEFLKNGAVDEEIELRRVGDKIQLAFFHTQEKLIGLKAHLEQNIPQLEILDSEENKLLLQIRILEA